MPERGESAFEKQLNGRGKVLTTGRLNNELFSSDS